MSAEAPARQDLQWVQALRGIAALMVLFFHMLPHWELNPVLALSSSITRWGFAGVDIFFALSGFVVYRSARRSIPTHGLWPFVKKRLLRIYLGYWPVLALIGLTTVYVHNESLPELQKMVMSTLLLYPNIWDNWLPPAWSLSMEIYFYMWIALIALLPAHHQFKAIVGVMLFLAAWGLYWLLTDRAAVLDGRQPLRYVFTGMGLEFLAGALVAHAYDRSVRWFQMPWRTAAVCLAVMAAGLALGMTSPSFDRVEILRFVSFGALGVGALVLALSLEVTSLKPPHWLVVMGDASFSLYLLHTFLLDYSGRLRFENGITAPHAVLAFLLALPVVIVLLSLLWYRLVEKPIMKAAL
jgi:exopolysaccharide production protein ExoZ